MTPVVGSNKLNQCMATGDWDQATALLQSDHTLATGRTPAPGFFGDQKTSDIFPIHQAIVSNAPISFLKLLINAYPKGLGKEESAYRRTPLHIACRNRLPQESIDLLIKHNPDAAGSQDNLGRVPLHYALSNGASLELVDSLITAFPLCPRAPDHNGWIPLHVACNQGASDDIITALVETYPEGTVLTNKSGHDAAAIAEKSEAPNSDNIVTLLQKIAHEESHKTELLRLRRAEQKAKDAGLHDEQLLFSKTQNRSSVRDVV